MKKKIIDSKKLSIKKEVVARMDVNSVKGGFDTLFTLDPENYFCGGSRRCESALYSWCVEGIPCY